MRRFQLLLAAKRIAPCVGYCIQHVVCLAPSFNTTCPTHKLFNGLRKFLNKVSREFGSIRSYPLWVICTKRFEPSPPPPRLDFPRKAICALREGLIVIYTRREGNGAVLLRTAFFP
ncbi:hypothetical protein Trydic_g7481 [Trypoxylus dichotomus]